LIFSTFLCLAKEKLQKKGALPLRKLLLKIEICKLNSSNLQPAVASNSRCFDACIFLIFYTQRICLGGGICSFGQANSSSGHSTLQDSSDNYKTLQISYSLLANLRLTKHETL